MSGDRRHADWFVAVVTGLMIGLVSVSLAVVGLALAGALLAGATLSRHRRAAVGGALLGFGIVWTLVWSSAALRCQPASCQGPDLTPWVAASVLIAVLGTGLSVAGLRATRR